MEQTKKANPETWPGLSIQARHGDKIQTKNVSRLNNFYIFFQLL